MVTTKTAATSISTPSKPSSLICQRSSATAAAKTQGRRQPHAGPDKSERWERPVRSRYTKTMPTTRAASTTFAKSDKKRRDQPGSPSCNRLQLHNDSLAFNRAGQGFFASNSSDRGTIGASHMCLSSANPFAGLSALPWFSRALLARFASARPRPLESPKRCRKLERPPPPRPRRQAASQAAVSPGRPQELATSPAGL